jgi:hypothetical protein
VIEFLANSFGDSTMKLGHVELANDEKSTSLNNLKDTLILRQPEQKSELQDFSQSLVCPPISDCFIINVPIDTKRSKSGNP